MQQWINDASVIVIRNICYHSQITIYQGEHISWIQNLLFNSITLHYTLYFDIRLACVFMLTLLLIPEHFTLKCVPFDGHFYNKIDFTSIKNNIARDPYISFISFYLFSCFYCLRFKGFPIFFTHNNLLNRKLVVFNKKTVNNSLMAWYLSHYKISSHMFCWLNYLLYFRNIHT